MDTEAEPRRRRAEAQRSVGHAVLYLDAAAHGIHNAPKVYEDAVAGPLHYAPVMRCDGGIDQIAPQPAQSRKGAILVGASEPAYLLYLPQKSP